MKNTLETRLGIFFALALVAGVIVLEMAGGLEKFRGGYHIYSLFKNVQQLKVGDPVKMAGVEVGRVSGLSLIPTNECVKVTLKIRRGVVIRNDSKATILFSSMLGGQNYVSLTFGKENIAIEPDMQLTAIEQPDINALMSKIDTAVSGIENATRSFTGDSLTNLVGPIVDFVVQNRSNLTVAITNISGTFANLKDISADVQAGRGTVGRLLKDDALYTSALTTVTNLSDTSTDVRAAIRQASLTLAVAKTVLEGVNTNIIEITQGKGTIGRLIKEDRLYTETTDAMNNLKEILQKVNRGQGSVGKLVNDESFLKNVKLSLQKLDKATEGLEDQGPLSVLGMAVNSLF